ncbi:MAG: hypothetical protein ABR564_00720, partial [Candidatus Dormibacteria bacterium]
MSDEVPRSAHGNRPPQRRGNSAPSWWPRLERADLPDEVVDGRAESRPAVGSGLPVPEERGSGPAARSRASSALIYLV